MITNEKQYRITNSWVKKLEKSLEALSEERKNAPDVRPKMQQAHIDATRSYIDELRAQLQEYDDLRGGRVAVPSLSAVEEVPRALIRARIASGMTQSQLAQALGLKTQQIQRYEASNYARASLSRIRQIAQVLIEAQSTRLKAA